MSRTNFQTKLKRRKCEKCIGFKKSAFSSAREALCELCSRDFLWRNTFRKQSSIFHNKWALQKQQDGKSKIEASCTQHFEFPFIYKFPDYFSLSNKSSNFSHRLNNFLKHSVLNLRMRSKSLKLLEPCQDLYKKQFKKKIKLFQE